MSKVISFWLHLFKKSHAAISECLKRVSHVVHQKVCTSSSEVRSLSACFPWPWLLADVHCLQKSCLQVHGAHAQACLKTAIFDASESTILLGTKEKQGLWSYQGPVVFLKEFGRPPPSNLTWRSRLPEIPVKSMWPPQECDIIRAICTVTISLLLSEHPFSSAK